MRDESQQAGLLRRLAEIDQELAAAEHGGSTSPVEATRSQLDVVRDFSSGTDKGIKDFRKSFSDTVEKLESDPDLSNLTDEIDWDGVGSYIDSLKDSGSSFGESLAEAKKYAEGVRSDFEGVGQLSPDEFTGKLNDFQGKLEGIRDGLLESVSIDATAIKGLLEDPAVKKALGSLQDGLKQGGQAIGDLDSGLDAVNEVLDTIENLGDVTGGDPQAQLEALGEVFSKLTDLFGGSITAIPGLGAFFTLYGKAFENSAQIAGTIDRIADRNNDLYRIDRSGKYLYLTDDALEAGRIKRLHDERARIVSELTDAAQAEYEAKLRPDVEATEPDIVFGAALRDTQDAKPDLMSPVYVEWTKASASLDEASARYGRSKEQVEAAQQQVDEARIESERSDSVKDPYADPVGAAESVLRSAQEIHDKATTDFDDAKDRYEKANDAHRAETGEYYDAVRDAVLEKGKWANNGKGLTADDWRYYNAAYPAFSIPLGSDGMPAIAEPMSAAPEPPAADPAGAVGGAAVSGGASTSSGTKKLVMLGGGGLLGISLVIGGFFVLGGNEDTPQDEAAVAAGAPSAEETPSEGEEPASDDDTTADEPPSEPASNDDTAADEPPPAPLIAVSIDPCQANPSGCFDYGVAVSGDGTTAWTPIDNCNEPWDGSDEARIDSVAIGHRLYLPGSGACLVGGGEVRCPGLNQQGQVTDSDGNVTLKVEGLQLLETTDIGIRGLAQEFDASPLEDGSPDYDNMVCTAGSLFETTFDPAVWASALASPVTNEPPIGFSGFQCAYTVDGDSVELSWVVRAELPLPTTGAPFDAMVSARFDDWVDAPVSVDGVIIPFDPAMGIPDWIIIEDSSDDVTTGTLGDGFPGPSFGSPEEPAPAAVVYQDGVALISPEGGDQIGRALATLLAPDTPDSGGLVPGQPYVIADENGIRDSRETLIFGTERFDPAGNPATASALDGFDSTEDLVDAQVALINGAFRVFAPSNVCSFIDF